MIGLGLGELVLAVILFCIAAFLIQKFGKDPYRAWGLWALSIFGIIYILERLHIFELLQRISI